MAADVVRRRSRVPMVLLVPMMLLIAVCLAGAVDAIRREGSARASEVTPLQHWLSEPVARIAHHGGDADWPVASPLAYENAAAWSPSLALEVSVRRSRDGVWVASEDGTTEQVFGRDLVVADTDWAELSTLRSTVGDQPMSRLQQTVLDRVARDRVVVVDDKSGRDADALLDLLDRYGGPSRFLVKSDGPATAVATAARARGYRTWGYYYPSAMSSFARTQGVYDMIGVPWNAPAEQWRSVRATGKRIFAFVVANRGQADAGLAAGATGLMVSGVTQVVPRG